MNLQRREEIRKMCDEPVRGGMQGALKIFNLRRAINELFAHIDTLEQTAAERVIADGKARAVVVPDYATMADLAWRHHFDPLHGPTDMFAAGRTAMYKAMCAELRPIPADRVLGEGMVHVSREELEVLRECADAVLNSAPEKTWSRNDTYLTRAARKISDLRANQGGAAT